MIKNIIDLFTQNQHLIFQKFDVKILIQKILSKLPGRKHTLKFR